MLTSRDLLAEDIPEWERELQAELQEYEVVNDGEELDDADLEKELMQQDSSEPANEEEKAKLAAAQAPGETAPTPTQDAAASAEAERADSRTLESATDSIAATNW